MLREENAVTSDTDSDTADSECEPILPSSLDDIEYTNYWGTVVMDEDRVDCDCRYNSPSMCRHNWDDISVTGSDVQRRYRIDFSANSAVPTCACENESLHDIIREA